MTTVKEFVTNVLMWGGVAFFVYCGGVFAARIWG